MKKGLLLVCAMILTVSPVSADETPHPHDGIQPVRHPSTRHAGAGKNSPSTPEQGRVISIEPVTLSGRTFKLPPALIPTFPSINSVPMVQPAYRFRGERTRSLAQ